MVVYKPTLICYTIRRVVKFGPFLGPAQVGMATLAGLMRGSRLACPEIVEGFDK